MKKTLYTKNKMSTKGGSKQKVEADAEAAKILRTVRDQEAFYFYESVGKPTGENARNLIDFLDKAKSIKTESLTFHLQRHDFQNWVQKILGDSKLATELSKTSSSNKEDIRTSICRIVENRIKELRESNTPTILAGETSFVHLPAVKA